MDHRKRKAVENKKNSTRKIMAITGNKRMRSLRNIHTLIENATPTH